MNRYRPINALKGPASSALGYSLVLGLGTGVGLMIGDEHFVGLGVVALTLLILAPLGAVTGAAMGLHIFGEPRRKRLSWLWLATAMATGAVVVAVGPGLSRSITWLILGLAGLLVTRTGMGALHLLETQPSLLPRAETSSAISD